MDILIPISEGALSPAVVPVMIGPMQALLAVLPGILAALGGMLLAIFRPSTVKKLAKLLWAQKLQVIAAAAVIWGAVHLAGRVLPDRGPEVAEADEEAEDWLQFRGSPHRAGHAPDGYDDPVQGGVNWSFSLGDSTHFYSSPTVVGNRVYIASSEVSLFDRQGTGYIFCFDADTGAEVWRGGPRDYRATFSSPAVKGNRLAIGEGLHETRDARVMVLDLDREGEVLWSYRTDSHAESSPVIHNDRVYFGSGQDGYYAFEIEPGEDGEPQKLWHVPGEDYPDASGSPGAYKDWIIVPMGRWGGNAVAALDADTGEEEWRLDTPYPVFSGPTVAEEHGVVLIGMGTGNYIQTAEEALPGELERLREAGATEEEIEEAREHLGPAGELWAIDLDTQEVRWSFSTPRAVIAQPAVDGNNVYIASRDGQVHRIDIRTGERVGVWEARDHLLASPAVGREHVYVVTNRGLLFALDKHRMLPVWDEPLAGPPSISSPTIARGQLYVGTTGSGMLSIGSSERPPETPLWGSDRGGPDRSGWEEGSLLTARGSYAWGYDESLPDPKEGTSPRVSAPPAALLLPADDEDAEGAEEHAVFVPWSDGRSHAIARLDFPDGVERAPVRTWMTECALEVSSPIAAVGNAVFVLEGQQGDDDRWLRALDVGTGEERWRYPVEAGAAGTLLLTRTHLLAAVTEGELSCFDLTEAGGADEAPVSEDVRWTLPLGQLKGTPMIDGDLLIAASADPARLTVKDLLSGETLWEQRLETAPRTGPVLVRDIVWIGRDDGVHGYDLFGGERIHTAGAEPPVDRLVVNGDNLAWVTENGTAKVFNAARGEIQASIEDVEPLYAPLLSDSGLLLLAEESLDRYDFETGERRFWARLSESWPGRPETPPFMIDRHLLFGATTHRLVSIQMEN